MDKLNDRASKLIRDYAESCFDLTDEEAEAMLKEFLAIEEAKLKVKTRHVKKFRRVLPPKKLARFYQAENKMDISVNYELSDVIPLVPVSEA
ncbi:MAG: hypothetical protein JSV16_03745, partial [Candidatus Hydrogenedentota bacterium]